MKRQNVVLLLVVAVAATAIVTVVSADSKPPGVPASAWVPIGTDLGIVVEPRDQAASGMLMIRRDGRWVPLALKGELELGPPVIPVDRSR